MATKITMSCDICGVEINYTSGRTELSIKKSYSDRKEWDLCSDCGSDITTQVDKLIKEKELEKTGQTVYNEGETPSPRKSQKKKRLRFLE